MLHGKIWSYKERATGLRGCHEEYLAIKNTFHDEGEAGTTSLKAELADETKS